MTRFPKAFFDNNNGYNTENGMKNWIPTTISIVAIGISIVAIAKVEPVEGLDFDYYGAIIGVLSFLVTLLMGYQIYTVINVKEELKEVRRTKDQIEKRIEAKGNELMSEYKDEISKTVPLVMALSSGRCDVIEKEIFKSYKQSLPNQLTKELAWQSINMIIAEAAHETDQAKRQVKLEELASNVEYEEVIEFYTEFAKQDEKKKLAGMEPFLLELIGILAERNNDGNKE